MKATIEGNMDILGILGADPEVRNGFNDIRWGIAAAILLLLLGVVFVIGGFGEIFARDPATVPRVVLVVGGLIAAIGGVALASLGVAVLVERFGRCA